MTSQSEAPKFKAKFLGVFVHILSRSNRKVFPKRKLCEQLLKGIRDFTAQMFKRR